MSEEQKLQNAVCDYLRLKFPNVLFMVSPSGIKLTIGQAKNLKRNQNPSKGWPDLFIAKVAIKDTDNPKEQDVYAGLFIELKREGTRLFKKNGEWATEHLEIQGIVHSYLKQNGYFATFAIGFDQAVKIIDEYLS